MGYGGGQFTHGGDPADVREVRLRLTQRFFGLLALNGDTRQMGDLLDEIMLLRSGTARFAIVDSEGPQNFAA